MIKKVCPFCRTPPYTSNEELMKSVMKRVEANDAYAVRNLGCYYDKGTNGYPQDHKKAFELFRRAAELGHAGAYTNIGYAHNNGEGVEVDKEKANHYYELAAMRGDSMARHNLGVMEGFAGNIDRALKHLTIAVQSGYAKSVERIKLMYSNGHATKEDYTSALRLYQAYLGEIKSRQRDKAAADNEGNRYY